MWQYGLSPFGMSSSMMFIVLMTAGLAAVLVCSYGFFLVFERPFMRSKQKVAASPRASASPATL
jgi:peptidoglycan/LPS O-acetylase OafA/YrhL